MASTTEVERTPVSVSAAISNAVVKITAQYTGRGPTKARTTLSGDLIVVVLQDALTKAERSLLAHGQGDFVMETRRRFQGTMRADLVAAVEMLTQRKVVAFMSANHMDPDMGAEIFVLEPHSNGPSQDASSMMSTTSRSAQAIAGSELGAARAAKQTT